MDVKEEILGAIELIVEQNMKNLTRIQNGTVIAINGKYCSMIVNGKQFDNVAFYGKEPIVNMQYRVFIPDGNMNLSFIMVP